MAEEDNSTSTEVAPQESEAPIEQPVAGENATETPSGSEENVDPQLILGKFKSQSDLENSYVELERKLSEQGQAKPEFTPQVPQFNPEANVPSVPSEIPQLDPDAALAVNAMIEQKVEEREVAKWLKANQEDLKPGMVDSRTKDLIRQGYERDTALAQAKKEYADIRSTEATVAKAEGFTEGQTLAKEKEMHGAIGSTASKKEVDVSKMTSAEYAQYVGLK
jgi:hypothetical protein